GGRSADRAGQRPRRCGASGGRDGACGPRAPRARGRRDGELRSGAGCRRVPGVAGGGGASAARARGVERRVRRRGPADGDDRTMNTSSAPAAPIRVVVAEDHPAVRSGLVALLGSAPDITVVAEAADGPAALEAARAHRPDVVLTDVRMPGATGIEITPRLRETGASVLVISGFDLDEFVLGALAAGADGYLVKSEDPQRILAAVRDV